MQPHRGVMILVLGILGLVTQCFPLGLVAWLIGRGDLKSMDAGRMDPTGRSLTQAGVVCGIIATCLAAVGLVVALLWILFVIVLGLGAAASGAAAAASGGLILGL